MIAWQQKILRYRSPLEESIEHGPEKRVVDVLVDVFNDTPRIKSFSKALQTVWKRLNWEKLCLTHLELESVDYRVIVVH